MVNTFHHSEEKFRRSELFIVRGAQNVTFKCPDPGEGDTRSRERPGPNNWNVKVTVKITGGT